MKGTLYRKGSNLEYRPFGPVEYVFDVCGFLSGVWSTLVMELVMKELKKRGNIFHPCPYSVIVPDACIPFCLSHASFNLQGHVYVHDVRVTEDTYAIAKLLPDGEFYYQAILYVKKSGKEVLLIRTKTFVEVLNRGVVKF